MARETLRRFELRVEPREDRGYQLSLWQSTPVRRGRGPVAPSLVARVQGDPLRLVLEQILALLKSAGYRPSELGPQRREPFTLKEEDGVRLGLLFLAVKPLRKLHRIESVADRVRSMETEEAYYWYSKTTTPESGPRGQRALRLLLAEE